MDTKKNSEKEFPGLPSYYTSRNPPSEIQVKWVLKYIKDKLWNENIKEPVDLEILHDFGIEMIEEDFLGKEERLAIIISK